MSVVYQMPVSPLLLQAQITPPAAGGSFGLADPTRLENPFQSPMWIDEIRFRLPRQSNATLASEWSRFRVKLELSGIPLTRDFVPMGLFGKVLLDGGVAGAGAMAQETITWKLPRPLFIPAREFLKPTLYFEQFPGAVTRTMTILYACRPLPRGTPTPQSINLPWVAYYKPADLQAGTVDQVDESNPSHVFNPWNEELHVQRFMGRLMGQNVTNDDEAAMQLASAAVDLNTGIVNCGTLVSAQDSFNNIVVRDETPFSHLFDQVDRSWTVNCVLPPKGFYIFNVQRLWANYTGAFTGTVGISMVGWREVVYASQRGY